MGLNDTQLGRMLQLVEDTSVDVKEIKKDVKGHDKRIGKLENYRGYITGGIAVLAIVFGILMKVL